MLWIYQYLNLICYPLIKLVRQIHFLSNTLHSTWPSEWKILVVRKVVGRLYVLDPSYCNFNSLHTKTFFTLPSQNTTKQGFFFFGLIICQSTMLLWHKRLGHMHYFVLLQLQLCKHDSGNCVLPCVVCSICREHMLSFPESFTQSSIFQI